MAKIGNLEVPDTKETIDVTTSPSGVEIVRRVVDKQGKILSLRVVGMPWKMLAQMVNDQGQEMVQDATPGGLIS